MRTLVLLLLASPVLLHVRIYEDPGLLLLASPVLLHVRIDEDPGPTPSCLTSPTPGKNI